MISYYLFMGLLCLTLILWAIIAIRDDTPPDGAEGAAGSKEPSGGPAAQGQSLGQSDKK